jgi:hypothetical protein
MGSPLQKLLEQLPLESCSESVLGKAALPIAFPEQDI